MTVDELLELPSLDFTNYVRENVGNDDLELWRILLDERIVHATRDTLTAIHLDVEAQFGQQKARLEEYASNRVGPLQPIACGTDSCLYRVPFDRMSLLEGIRTLFRHWVSAHPDHSSGEPLYLYKNLRSTLSQAQREYMEAEADYNEWKRRAMGYKQIVRRRLEEAKLAAIATNTRRMSHRTTRRGVATTPNPIKIQHNIRSLFALAYAVYQHRQACLEAGLVPEAHDVKLWEMLDIATSYSTEHGAQPLIEWLENMMAKPDWTPPGERH